MEINLTHLPWLDRPSDRQKRAARRWGARGLWFFGQFGSARWVRPNVYLCAPRPLASVHGENQRSHRGHTGKRCVCECVCVIHFRTIDEDQLFWFVMLSDSVEFVLPGGAERGAGWWAAGSDRSRRTSKRRRRGRRSWLLNQQKRETIAAGFDCCVMAIALHGPRDRRSIKR